MNLETWIDEKILGIKKVIEVQIEKEMRMYSDERSVSCVSLPQPKV